MHTASTVTDVTTATLNFRTTGDFDQDGDYELTFKYSDSYFQTPSTTYNPQLATMSLCLAVSAFNSFFNETEGEQPYLTKYRNVLDLFKKINIAEDRICYNEFYTQPPTSQTIGVIVGSKTIDISGTPYTLLVVGVRGGGYEKEWVSNAELGAADHHTGFTHARDLVVQHIKEYVANFSITGPVKLWIAGFSRAAATSNLVAGYLDNNPTLSSTVTLLPQDLYAYCFETPAGAYIDLAEKRAEKYKNIWNIINPSDVVTYLAPVQFGFRRYGTDLLLPTIESSPNYNTVKAEMLKQYTKVSSITRTTSPVDEFHMKTLKLSNFLKRGKKVVTDDSEDPASLSLYVSNLMELFTTNAIKDRGEFVEKLQSPAMKVLELVNGPFSNMVDAVSDSLSSLIIGEAFTGIFGTDDTMFTSLRKTLNEHGITNFSQTVLDDLVTILKRGIYPLFDASPRYVLTLGLQAANVMSGHYPELCYAWLAAMDPSFNKNTDINTTSVFTYDMQRVVNIHGEVDVQVHQLTTLVANITDDTPVRVDGSTLVYGLDNDEEKYIILPGNSAYTLTVTPRSSAQSTNYSITIRTRSVSFGSCVRNLGWLEQACATAGATLTIPALTEDELTGNFASLSQYILTSLPLSSSHTNSIVTPSFDYNVTEINNSTMYNISADSSNDEAGSVLGTGVRYHGQYALLTAEPSEGSTFEGWYLDDKEYSTDSRIKVLATKDTIFEARFHKPWTAGEIFLRIILPIVVAVIVLVVISVLCYYCCTRCCKCCCCCGKDSTRDKEVVPVVTELESTDPPATENTVTQKDLEPIETSI